MDSRYDYYFICHQCYLEFVKALLCNGIKKVKLCYHRIFFLRTVSCLTILSLPLTYLILFLIIMSLHLAVRIFKMHKQMLQSNIYFFMFSSTVAEIGFHETDWSIHRQKNKILTAENRIVVCNKKQRCQYVASSNFINILLSWFSTGK